MLTALILILGIPWAGAVLVTGFVYAFTYDGEACEDPTRARAKWARHLLVMLGLGWAWPVLALRKIVADARIDSGVREQAAGQLSEPKGPHR